jgi:hypothetical protein
MATLMQKDAVVEMLASTMAQIMRYEDINGENEDSLNDWKSVSTLKRSLYSTNHNDIDFPKIVKFKTELKEKYPA